MVLPESERHTACLKGIELLGDPRTEIMAMCDDGIALRGHEGNILTVTRHMIAFESGAK